MDGVSGNNGTAVQISIPSIFWFLACSEAIFVTFFLTLLMELDYFRVHKSFTAVADDRTTVSYTHLDVYKRQLPTFERYARPEDTPGKYTRHKKTKALKTL